MEAQWNPMAQRLVLRRLAIVPDRRTTFASGNNGIQLLLLQPLGVLTLQIDHELGDGRRRSVQRRLDAVDWAPSVQFGDLDRHQMGYQLPFQRPLDGAEDPRAVRID